jgi:hypothetical protein
MTIETSAKALEKETYIQAAANLLRAALPELRECAFDIRIINLRRESADEAARLGWARADAANTQQFRELVEAYPQLNSIF